MRRWERAFDAGRTHGAVRPSNAEMDGGKGLQTAKAPDRAHTAKLHIREKRFQFIDDAAPLGARQIRAPMRSVEWLETQNHCTQSVSPDALRWVDMLFPRSVLAQDSQPKLARVMRAVILVTSSLLVLALPLRWARDIHDTWENWRSDRLVSQAENCFNNGDYGSGFARANNAYLDCPQNEDAIRCLAHRCAEVGAAESLFFFDQLDLMGRTTGEDSTAKVSAYMRRNQLKEAQALACSLLLSGHDSQELLELGCTLENAGFPMPQVLNKKTWARIMSGGDARASFALSLLWMKSDVTGQRALAEDHLWKLAESGDMGMARKAAAALHGNMIPTDPRSMYLSWIMTEQPGADAAHQILALSRLVGVAPGNQDAWLKGVVDVWRNRPVDERILLGRLLFERARPQWLTGLFSHGDAVRIPHVAELYVAGLMSAGKIEDCKSLLKDRELPISRAQRSYAEAKIAIRSRCDAETARHRLLYAFGAASAEANPSLLTGVAELAVEKNLSSLAVQAYEECLTIHGSEAGALDGLIATCDVMGDTEKMRKTVRRALALWPCNERYMEMSIYINLLLGSDMEQSFALATRLNAARPDDDMRIFLVAMAHARLGNTVGAQVELRRLCSRGGMPMRYLAVIGGLLKGSGDSATARMAVSGIFEHHVTLPEEKAFLALAKL